jgi:hypothetical protein
MHAAFIAAGFLVNEIFEGVDENVSTLADHVAQECTLEKPESVTIRQKHTTDVPR